MLGYRVESDNRDGYGSQYEYDGETGVSHLLHLRLRRRHLFPSNKIRKASHFRSGFMLRPLALVGFISPGRCLLISVENREPAGHHHVFHFGTVAQAHEDRGGNAKLPLNAVCSRLYRIAQALVFVPEQKFAHNAGFFDVRVSHFVVLDKRFVTHDKNSPIRLRV